MCIHHVSYRSQVRSAHFSIALYKLVNLINVVPTCYLLVQDEVHQHSGWCTTHACCAVDVHVQPFVIDHVVEHLGTLIQTSS